MPPLSIAYIMEQWVVANQQERDTCCPAARVLLGLWAYCEAALGIYFYVRLYINPHGTPGRRGLPYSSRSLTNNLLPFANTIWPSDSNFSLCACMPPGNLGFNSPSFFKVLQ